MRDYKMTLRDTRFLEWRETPVENGSVHKPKIIWLTSKRPTDQAISHIALDLIESFEDNGNSGAPIYLHSLHQEGFKSTTLPDNIRTPCTLLKEAIFQLIQYKPKLVHEIERLQGLCHRNLASPTSPSENREDSSSGNVDMGLKELGLLLRDMLNSCAATPSCTQTSKNGIIQPSSSFEPSKRSPPPLPIFWIIDRIDKCAFKCNTAPKTELKPLYRNGPNLRQFADVLEMLVSEPEDRRGNGKIGGRGVGRLRVLITSLYKPSCIDAEWSKKDEDEDEDSYTRGRGCSNRRSGSCEVWEEWSV
jgi:hypothetical protein